jgi:hypothetical protein
MTEIVRRQRLLSITSPIPAQIDKAWDYFPPDSVGVPDTYTFMSSWSFIDTDNDASQLVQHYVVHMQLFVKDADRDQAAKIATAFHVAFVAAFAPHPTLSGIVTDQKIRGGTPTLAVLPRNGIDYMGLDLYMDLTLKDPMTFDVN